MSDRQIRQTTGQIKQLAEAVQPEFDLWPHIRARLTPRNRRPALLRLATAAVIVTAVGASAILLVRQEIPPPPITVPVARKLPAIPSDYFAQRRAFVMQVTAGDSRIDPRTRAALLKDLAAVESAIESIQRALQDDPNNPALQHLLNESYRTESEVINAAVRAQVQNPTRSDL